MKEVWKDIEGYKDYQVSTLGIIKSFKHIQPRILKLKLDRYGYVYIGLCANRRHKNLKVHRLVATAFLGKSNLTVNHKNGNKINNTVDNLEWVSLQDNLQHAKINNFFPIGKRNVSSKLSELDLRLIKFKYLKGKSQSCIAKEFGVLPGSIYLHLKKMGLK